MANKYAKRKDGNHSQIAWLAKNVKSYGCLSVEVKDVHNFPGMLDFVLRIGAMPFFLEVKKQDLETKDSSKFLTSKEKEFLVPFIVVFSEKDFVGSLKTFYQTALEYTEQLYEMTNAELREPFIEKFVSDKEAFLNNKKKTKPRKSFVQIAIPNYSNEGEGNGKKE